jgi:5'-3' exonuclease
MGVPAFFRWLTVRYPQVAIDALQDGDLEQLAAEFRKERKEGRLAQDPNEIDVNGGSSEEDLLQ